jgi:hypothetical protein
MVSGYFVVNVFLVLSLAQLLMTKFFTLFYSIVLLAFLFVELVELYYNELASFPFLTKELVILAVDSL